MVPSVDGAAQLSCQENGKEQQQAGADILQSIDRSGQGNSHSPQQRIALAKPGEEADESRPTDQPFPAPGPLDQIQYGHSQGYETQNPIYDQPDRHHTDDGFQRSHAGRIIEPGIIVGIIGALYNNVCASLYRKSIHTIHHIGFIGLYASLLPRQRTADVNASGAQQLRHIERQHLGRFTFEAQAVGGYAVGRTQMRRKVWILSDISVGFRHCIVGKILRAQQLPGIVLPAVHQEAHRILRLRQHVAAIVPRKRRGILIVPVK